MCKRTSLQGKYVKVCDWTLPFIMSLKYETGLERSTKEEIHHQDTFQIGICYENKFKWLSSSQDDSPICYADAFIDKSKELRRS